MKNKYTLAVLGAGTLWGFMGFFRRSLDSMGLSAMGCIAVRCAFGALMFGITMLITDPKTFKVKPKDAWIFICCSLVSFLIFEFCYFKSMDYMSLSTAAILLYTAPMFVIVMSALIFKEKLTVKKLIAMLVAFAGCCLVCGIGTGGGISPTGLAFGLGSGFCYATFSIFSRFAIKRGYSTFTINFYACLLAGIGAILIDGTGFVTAICGSGTDFILALGTGFFTCFLPYMLYTFGLVGLENGKASIMASIEPVVATLCGFLIYNETLTLFNCIGIALVLAAIVLLNVGSQERKNSIKE